MEIITVDNFSFRYPDSKNDSLNNINIGIDEGDFVLICGKSGCGKTCEYVFIGDSRDERNR